MKVLLMVYLALGDAAARVLVVTCMVLSRSGYVVPSPL